MENKGKLVVFSGPSGVGKGTIMKKLLQADEKIALSVSATTRKRREGEEHGVHYFYITKEEFEQKIRNNEMLEYTSYNGNFYGTIQSHVEELLDNGKTVMLEIDVDGAAQIKKKFPDALSVFVTAPSVEEIERRLRFRNTEDDEAIKNRIAIAKNEMTHANEYDYIVCNDDVDAAANKILEIIK